jgi:maleate isomerase/arylmalonate decarboxylase
MVNSFSGDTTYGTRAKLGLIVPPTNTVNEAEWHKMVPDGVTFHVTRMALHADTSSSEGKKALYADIKEATEDLAQAGLSVISYGCTAGSMAQPLNQLSDFMSGVSGLPCITTASAIVNALNYLNIKKISIATPYHEALNKHEVKFLADNGFETLKISGLGIGGGGPHEYIEIARTSMDDIKAHILSVDHPGAEAIIVSCTDFPSLSVIAELEKELGKPVISSNQATLWAALRAADIIDYFDNFGTLLTNNA